jgi:hypothetical protein
MTEALEVVLWSAALATWILIFIGMVANGAKTCSSWFRRRLKTESHPKRPSLRRTTTP